MTAIAIGEGVDQNQPVVKPCRKAGYSFALIGRPSIVQNMHEPIQDESGGDFSVR